MWKLKNKIYFKMIAIVVTGVFLWHQIAWAQDTIIQPTSSQNIMPSIDSNTGQILNEAAIANKNAIEDFIPNTNSKTTHNMEYDRVDAKTNNWTYYYLNNRLQERVYKDNRAYIYKEYHSNGRQKVLKYYRAGNVYDRKYTYLYDDREKYNGKKIEYVDGRVYEYNSKNKIVKLVYANGKRQIYTRRTDGKILTQIYYNANGTIIYSYIYTYDGAGKVVSSKRTYADGRVYEYNSKKQIVKLVYANGKRQIYTRRTDGKILTQIYYNANGTIIYSYIYTYDGAGKVVSSKRTYVDGRVYEYNSKNQIVKFVYANGKRQIYTRRTDGKILTQIYYNANGTIIYSYMYTYDGAGKVVSSKRTYADGRVYDYNARRQLIKLIYSNGRCQIYVRRSDGQIITQTYYNADGSVIHSYTYTYDTNGRKTGSKRIYSDGRVYEYNAKRQLTKLIYSNGRRQIYVRRSDGKIITQTYYDTNGEMIYSYVYTYDSSGKVTARTREYADGKVYYYDGKGKYSGRKIVYSNGRVCEQDSKNKIVKMIQVNGDYEVYKRLSNGKVDTVTYYKKKNNVICAYKCTYKAVCEDKYIYNTKGEQKELIKYFPREQLVEIYNDKNTAIRRIYPDLKTIEYFYDAGNVLTGTYKYLSDGTIHIFNNKNELIYTYIPSEDQALDSTDDSAVSVTTSNGDIIKYKNGEIYEVILKEDDSIIKNIVLDDEGKLVNAEILYTDGRKGIVYKGEVIQSIFADGTIVRYRDGRKTTEYNKNVGLNRYSYIEDAEGEISQIFTVNNETECLYDEDGVPIAFKKPTGEITEFENGHLKKIVTEGGKEYFYNYINTQPPRSVITVQGVTDNSIPAEVHYNNDDKKSIEKIVMLNGSQMTYSEGVLAGIQGLTEQIGVDTEGKFVFDGNSYQRHYDQKGDLEKIITEDKTSIYFTEGEISEVHSEDGSRVLYTGGNISEIFDKKQGVSYETDESARPIKATYANGDVFNYTYEIVEDDITKVTITQQDKDSTTIRHYKEDILVWQRNLLGVISEYKYETIDSGKRISEIIQTKNNKDIGHYIYEYLEEKTIVTDIDGMRREYDKEGNIKFLYKQDGHVYNYHLTEYNTLVKELVRYHKKDSSGRVIYYKNGDIDYVESPDGTVLKDISFEHEGVLRNFTVVYPNKDTRHCNVHEDDWSEIVSVDGTKLLYKGNDLVAVNSNHKLLMFDETKKIPSSIELDISEDPDALDYIDIAEGEISDYMRFKLLKDHGAVDKTLDYVTISHDTDWEVQNHGDTKGIKSVSNTGDTIIADAGMNGSSYSEKQGEVYLDLAEYSEFGTLQKGHYDFDNKRLSFYVKLEDNTLDDNNKLTLQAFAKSNDWKSEYSIEVTLTKDGVWHRVDLEISDKKPIFGLMDPGFDPKKVRLVGLRLKTPGTGTVYNGKIYIKDANHSNIAETERIIDAPFLVNKESVESYIGSVPGNQTVNGNPNYISWTDIPTVYFDGNNTPAASDNSSIDLDKGIWRAQDIVYSRVYKK